MRAYQWINGYNHWILAPRTWDHYLRWKNCTFKYIPQIVTGWRFQPLWKILVSYYYSQYMEK